MSSELATNFPYDRRELGKWKYSCGTLGLIPFIFGGACMVVSNYGYFGVVEMVLVGLALSALGGVYFFSLFLGRFMVRTSDKFKSVCQISFLLAIKIAGMYCVVVVGYLAGFVAYYW